MVEITQSPSIQVCDGTQPGRITLPQDIWGQDKDAFHKLIDGFQLRIALLSLMGGLLFTNPDQTNLIPMPQYSTALVEPLPTGLHLQRAPLGQGPDTGECTSFNYIVKPGDNPYRIAMEINESYGTQYTPDDIMRLAGIVDPRKLPVGTIINLQSCSESNPEPLPEPVISPTRTNTSEETQPDLAQPNVSNEPFNLPDMIKRIDALRGVIGILWSEGTVGIRVLLAMYATFTGYSMIKIGQRMIAVKDRIFELLRSDNYPIFPQSDNKPHTSGVNHNAPSDEQYKF